MHSRVARILAIATSIVSLAASLQARADWRVQVTIDEPAHTATPSGGDGGCLVSQPLGYSGQCLNANIATAVVVQRPFRVSGMVAARNPGDVDIDNIEVRIFPLGSTSGWLPAPYCDWRPVGVLPCQGNLIFYSKEITDREVPNPGFYTIYTEASAGFVHGQGSSHYTYSESFLVYIA